MGGAGGRGEVQSDINVTPMADVMLVLLIIFMVITPMLQKGVSVELAQTTNPIDMQEADQEDAVLVSVTRDGRFYLGPDDVRLEELPGLVVNMLSGRLDKTVYVKSDFRARYGDVVAVVDTVRAAGVDRIGLLTERLDSAVRQ
jgi:biopolymer transport protein ExbD/biopolymer transport protein TolR